VLGRGILCGQAGSQLAIVMPAKLRGATAFPICRRAHFAEHLINSISSDSIAMTSIFRHAAVSPPGTLDQ
jgi:hypothetical protein